MLMDLSMCMWVDGWSFEKFKSLASQVDRFCLTKRLIKKLINFTAKLN